MSNAFATSVGSGALTLRDAVAIAAVCEFSGAVLMGGAVTETIRKGIADVTQYDTEPEVLMYGMMCVLLAVGTWLLIATKLGMPVSTTHSTVGAVMGMSMVARGSSSVYWGEATTGTFPWLTGVAQIILAWVLSPVLSATAAATLFVILRAGVLRSSRPLRAALAAFPVIVSLTTTLNVYLLLSKGTTINSGSDAWPVGLTVGVAFGTGAIAGVVTAALTPALRRRVDAINEAMALEEKEKSDKQRASESPQTPEVVVSIGVVDGSERPSFEHNTFERRDSFTSFQGGFGTHKVSERGSDGNSDVDVASDTSGSDAKDKNNFGCQYGVLRDWAMQRLPGYDETTETVVANDSKTVQAIHKNAERFDVSAEMLLTYLQVFTACVDSFAHGANDVANACGPFAAIWGIYRTSDVGSNREAPVWILLVGGFGLVFGLASLGKRIIKQIGMRLSKITPSRGLCIELGAALVVLLGTKYGIPLSTTHCQVGATTGVAMLEGAGGVNWRLLMKVVFGWCVTLLVAALAAAAFTAQGLYAPHITRHAIGEL